MLNKIKNILSLNNKIKLKERQLKTLNESISNRKRDIFHLERRFNNIKNNHDIIYSVDFLLRPRNGVRLDILLKSFLDDLPTSRYTQEQKIIFEKLVRDNVK